MKKEEKRNLVLEGANVAQDYKEDEKQSCMKERKLHACRKAPVLILVLETVSVRRMRKRRRVVLVLVLQKTQPSGHKRRQPA
jgi:hypothetical protein